MKIPLINLIERLRSSQWVLPGVLALTAVGSASLAVQLDQWAEAWLPKLPWFFFSGSMDDARQLLATLSGAMVSLTTITLSVTMIVLTLASNQFGPRVLRNFLRDHFNQMVLGSFVATLLYCLLLLGRLPAGGLADPPRIAVSLAMLLTVGCLFALLGFVHHTAKSIQSSEVVQEASDQLTQCVQKLYPKPISAQSETEHPIEDHTFDSDSLHVIAANSGYLQAVDLDTIAAWSRNHDTVVKVVPQPGDFVTSGDPLAIVAAASEKTDFEPEIRKCFILGNERTGEQDARYGFRQLVEIAVRALSPGTNDPFTALNAIDHIGCALAVVSQREPTPRHLVDSDGELRIVTPSESFSAIAQDAFAPLRFYGGEHPLVLERLLKMLNTLSHRAVRQADQDWVDKARNELRDLVAKVPQNADRERLNKLL